MRNAKPVLLVEYDSLYAMTAQRALKNFGAKVLHVRATNGVFFKCISFVSI